MPLALPKIAMPPKDRLEQLKLLLEVVLLLVAVPVVIWQIFTHPHRVRDRALGKLAV